MFYDPFPPHRTIDLIFYFFFVLGNMSPCTMLTMLFNIIYHYLIFFFERFTVELHLSLGFKDLLLLLS